MKRQLAFGCCFSVVLLVATWAVVRYWIFPRLGEFAGMMAGMQRSFEDPVLPVPVLPIPPLEESLAKIELWLADHHAINAAALRPGLDPAEVDRQLAAAGLSSSAELRTLYGWHDGQERVGMLIPGYRFLPLAEAIAENRAPMWSTILPADWLPILFFDGTDMYIVPSHRNTEAGSPLYDFFLEDTDVGIPYPSLTAFFAEEVARFAAGAYPISDEGHFDLDTAIEWQVHGQYYPGSGPLHHVMTFEDTRLPDGSLKRVTDLGGGTRIQFAYNSRGHLLKQIYLQRGKIVEVRVETTELDAQGRPLRRRYKQPDYPSEVTWEWKDSGEVFIRHRVNGKLSSTTRALTRDDGSLKVLAVNE